MIRVRPIQSDDLHGELKVNWHGRETTLSWRLLPMKSQPDFCYLAFRDKANPDGYEFFVASKHEPCVPLVSEARCMLFDATSDINSRGTIHFYDDELEHVLAFHIENSLYGYGLMLGSDELKHPAARWVFLNATGGGCWSTRPPADREHGEKVTFDAAGFAELGVLENLSPAQIRGWVLQELEKPTSKMRFALNWLELSTQQHLELIYPVENGDWSDFRRVLEFVLRWEIARQNESGAPCQWQWSIPLAKSAIEYIHRDGQWFTNARLRRWRKVVMEFFNPRYDSDLVKAHRCIGYFLSHYTPAINVSVKSPSQHEVLEAHLFLREWAEGKIEPKLIKLLLPSHGLQR